MTIEMQHSEQEDEKLARHILAELTLPPEIERIDVALRDDSTGDPALYLSFVLAETAQLTQETISRLSRFMMSVANQFLRSGIPRFPYVSLDQAA